MLTPGRKFSAGSSYRYGFNGKENDKAISEGMQDYGMRIYDARLGRFLSVDPLSITYPYYTPFQFSGNDPTKFIDIDGKEPGVAEYRTNATLIATATKVMNDVLGPVILQLKGLVSTSTGTAKSEAQAKLSLYQSWYADVMEFKHKLLREKEQLIGCLKWVSAVQKDVGNGLDAMAQAAQWIPFLKRKADGVRDLAKDGIDKTGDAEEALLQNAADEANKSIEPGKGHVRGTNVHTAFKNIVDELRSDGVDVTPEVSYKDGKVVPYGTKGSVRADAVVGDVNSPSAVYDLKTGDAKMSTTEVQNYKNNVPSSVNKIAEIKPHN